jgi:hypothetical protein
MAPLVDQDVSRWIREHQRDMILCPHQPGLLLISKKACLKRYRAALGRVFEAVSEEDAFHYALKKGLSLCEGCPIGRRLVEEERRSGAAHESDAVQEAVSQG